MKKYNRPQVVDVSLARAKFDQRRRASDLPPGSSKQVPRNQTVEEVVQMHKEYPWLYNITEKGPYFLPRSVRRNTTRRTKYPFTMRSERPPSALHRLYAATFTDSFDRSTLPMPALDSGWLAESGSIPETAQWLSFEHCARLCLHVYRKWSVLRGSGESICARISNEDNEAAFPFVDPATLDIHNSDAPEISSPTGGFAGKANRTEDADRPSTINYPPLPAKPRAAKISDETFSNGPALIEHIDAGEMLRVGGNLTTTIDDINTTLQRLDFVFLSKRVAPRKLSARGKQQLK